MSSIKMQIGVTIVKVTVGELSPVAIVGGVLVRVWMVVNTFSRISGRKVHLDTRNLMGTSDDVFARLARA